MDHCFEEGCSPSMQNSFGEFSLEQRLPRDFFASGYCVRNTFIDAMCDRGSVQRVRRAASEPPRSRETMPRIQRGGDEALLQELDDSETHQNLVVSLMQELDDAEKHQKMVISYLQLAMMQNCPIEVAISVAWLREEFHGYALATVRQRLQLSRHALCFETVDDLLTLEGLAFRLQNHVGKFPKGILFMTSMLEAVFYIGADSSMMQISWAECFDLHFGERPPCFFLDPCRGFPLNRFCFLIECELECPSADFASSMVSVTVERFGPKRHRRFSRTVWSQNLDRVAESSKTFCIQNPYRFKRGRGK